MCWDAGARPATRAVRRAGELALDGCAPVARLRGRGARAAAVQPAGRRRDDRRAIPARASPVSPARRARARPGLAGAGLRLSPSCGACSSRAPTPTAPCTPRPGSSSPASGRLATRSPTAPCSGGRRSITSRRALEPRRPSAWTPAVLAALRLGLFQLLFLGGIADHAAVDESVELVKRSSRGGAGLVNAVLRRAAREGAGCSLAELHDRHRRRRRRSCTRSRSGWPSCGGPSSGAERGPRAAAPPSTSRAESALRVNTLVSDPATRCRRELPVASRPAPWHARGAGPRGRRSMLTAPPLCARGAIMPQSRASMLVARALGPAARGAGAGSVRRSGGQDDASGRADGRPRAS